MKYCCLIYMLLLIGSCKPKTNPWPATSSEKQSAVTVKILPLGKTDEKFIQSTLGDLRKVFKNVVLLSHEEMPANAYFAPRKRYRADTLIAWMSQRAEKNEVYLGITRQDISTTKGSNPDHGIFGLGYQPGNACVASDFRLRNKAGFYKVVVHELGHTTGLPHCPEKTCYMRDAEGGNPTDEEIGFCEKCKPYLKEKGWGL